MPGYTRKIRVRKRRGVYVFEELVPSASGSYYVRRRTEAKGSNLKDGIKEFEALQPFLDNDEAPS